MSRCLQTSSLLLYVYTCKCCMAHLDNKIRTNTIQMSGLMVYAILDGSLAWILFWIITSVVYELPGLDGIRYSWWQCRIDAIIPKTKPKIHPKIRFHGIRCICTQRTYTLHLLAMSTRIGNWKTYFTIPSKLGCYDIRCIWSNVASRRCWKGTLQR